ncbi:MAG: transporter [Dysgonamonadaceae bacterium]|jgi:Tol biopolymer transport system component|nr:transporter [Dysgonamonadaceae bacterium]
MKSSIYLKVNFILFYFLCLTAGAAAQNKTVCQLEIYDFETGKCRILKEFPYIVEAPNWTKDGKSLIYNSGGKIYRIDIQNPASDTEINSGFAVNCNNDHVLSATGDRIAVSHHTAEDRRSRIYLFPLTGGQPVLITPMAPSYLHGWSPDEKTLAYCAERNGNYDVYSIPADGGLEKRLTSAEGLDDGPEFSPCGKYIWFNSVRSGQMQIWRMNADGSEQTPMTFDADRHSWFPHVSPDGEKVAYIAYQALDVAPGDHPPGKNVELRWISAQGGEAKTLVNLFGGQGTINVNSWAPDSKRLAFVSYVP